jgi:ATP-dependent helicase/nuclease subunit B
VFGEIGEVLPAGVMYVNVNPVIITIKRDEGLEEAEKELRNKRKRSGLLINDSSIIAAMDTTESGEFLPDVKKDENLATIEEFGQLFGHIEKLLAKMGNGLLAGRIEKNPVILPGDRDGGTCKYCDFAPYCDREGCRGEYKYAKGKAIYEKIKEDGKGDTHA